MKLGWTLCAGVESSPATATAIGGSIRSRIPVFLPGPTSIYPYLYDSMDRTYSRLSKMNHMAAGAGKSPADGAIVTIHRPCGSGIIAVDLAKRQDGSLTTAWSLEATIHVGRIP
jgi:hypothetical protein